MSADPHSLKPLPARPSLEFERKAARRLLRALRSGDPDALARVRAQHKPSDQFKLSDAQFTIAREYGFSSWPRLVEYFTALSRQERSPRRESYPKDYYEQQLPDALRMQGRRRLWWARRFAAFLPRFYGVSLAEVLRSEVSEDEAHLAIARHAGYASWQALLEEAPPKRSDPWEYFESPRRLAHEAIQQSDLERLQNVIHEHPELISPAENGQLDELMYSALINEETQRTATTRAIPEWLAAQGLDTQNTLNRMLLGAPRMRIEKVAWLLERGADPNWIAPDGFTVLEHAIYRYWDGAVVDLIARRVQPRKKFWIAAGLGDVQSLDRYIDRNGVPKEEAYRNRPDFTVVGPLFHLPSLPHADPVEVVWEAFLAAGLNSRFNVLDVLLERGFPINFDGWGDTLLHRAIYNQLVDVVEYLVRRGAADSLDPMHRAGSALENAMRQFQYSQNPQTRRILELCGGNPEEVVRPSRKPITTPLPMMRNIDQLFDLAREEALRFGQATVQPDNLLVALLRGATVPTLAFLLKGRVDVRRLRTVLKDRLAPINQTSSSAVPFSIELETVLKLAQEDAHRRMREYVGVEQLMFGLIASDTGPVAGILGEADASLERIRAAHAPTALA